MVFWWRVLHVRLWRLDIHLPIYAYRVWIIMKFGPELEGEELEELEK